MFPLLTSLSCLLDCFTCVSPFIHCYFLSVYKIKTAITAVSWKRWDTVVIHTTRKKKIASFLPKITLHNSRVTWSATSGRMSSTDEIIKKWCFKNFKSGIFWYFENWIFCYTCLIGYFVAGSYVVLYFVIGYSVPDVLSLDILSGYPIIHIGVEAV